MLAVFANTGQAAAVTERKAASHGSWTSRTPSPDDRARTMISRLEFPGRPMSAIGSMTRSRRLSRRERAGELSSRTPIVGIDANPRIATEGHGGRKSPSRPPLHTRTRDFPIFLISPNFASPSLSSSAIGSLRSYDKRHLWKLSHTQRTFRNRNEPVLVNPTLPLTDGALRIN